MGLFTWICVGVVAWDLFKAIKRKFQDREHCTAYARRRIVEGVAGMLSKMAKADGHVSKEEVDVAEQFLRRLKFDDDEFELAKQCFNRAMDNELGIDHYARMFASVTSTEACRLVYEMLWEIAAADGHLDPAEDRLLHWVVSELGFADSIYHFYRCQHICDFYADQGRTTGGESWRQSGSCNYGGRSSQSNGGSYGHGGYSGAYGGQSRERTELEKAYAKLGCSPSDSDDQVRAAYRKQAMRYHPDRLRAEGLPEGMLKQANQSMAEINAAWDLIRESRAR